MAKPQLSSKIAELDDQALMRQRDRVRADLDRLTERLNAIQGELFDRKQRSIRPAGERRRDALAIAKTQGPKTVAAVKKMKFSDTVTAKQKAIARQLAKKAQKAREKHSADAA